MKIIREKLKQPAIAVRVYFFLISTTTARYWTQMRFVCGFFRILNCIFTSTIANYAVINKPFINIPRLASVT